MAQNETGMEQRSVPNNERIGVAPCTLTPVRLKSSLSGRVWRCMFRDASLPAQLPGAFPDAFSRLRSSDPEAAFMPPDALLCVKSNYRRSVWRFRSASGREYYLKLDTPDRPFDRLKAFFRNGSKSEFRSFELLRAAAVPTADYCAYGISGSSSFLLTESLGEGMLSAREFFFRFAKDDANGKKKFLDALLPLCSRLAECGIRHPDFHAGNVMCPQQSATAFLLDLYGVERVGSAPLPRTERLALAAFFTDFACYFNEDEVARIFHALGWTDSCDLFSCWVDLIARRRKRIDREWSSGKRPRQLRSGVCKFFRQERFSETGRTIRIRNSAWFTPESFDSASAFVRELPLAEAMACWEDSFHREMLNPRTRYEGNPPLAFEFAERDCRDGVVTSGTATGLLYYAAPPQKNASDR